jgi:hypothetical protein
MLGKWQGTWTVPKHSSTKQWGPLTRLKIPKSNFITASTAGCGSSTPKHEAGRRATMKEKRSAARCAAWGVPMVPLSTKAMASITVRMGIEPLGAMWLLTLGKLGSAGSYVSVSLGFTKRTRIASCAFSKAGCCHRINARQRDNRHTTVCK